MHSLQTVAIGIEAERINSSAAEIHKEKSRRITTKQTTKHLLGGLYFST